MRYILLILTMFLVGCAAPGIHVYEPVVFNTEKGQSAKSLKTLAINADLAGVESLTYKDLNLKFGKPTVSQHAVVNRQGEVVAILTKTDVPGIYTTQVIGAQGEAVKKIVDAIASGVTGAVLSAAGATALGSGLSAIPVN